ncbi:MAG: winged helix-turn-helix domain-containing protein [Burkholderiaceae bacterium]
MSQSLVFSQFELQISERKLIDNGQPVTLGARAFDVLCALVDKAGELVSKAHLFDTVWPGLVVEENNLQVHISTLRKLLGPDAIATVPGRGYRFTAPVQRRGAAASAPLPPPAAARAIAVLPFVNLSEDPQQEYLSDGLSEDIIAKLSRSPWLFVIARNSSFVFRPPLPATADICRQLGTRYLVSGSVRRSGETVRISCELVDGPANETLWSQRFDRPLADLFAVQEQISGSIASAIEPVYLRREEKRFNRAKPAAAGTAPDTTPELAHWELLMRARWHFWRSSKKHLDAAQKCLAEAMAAKPDDPACLSLMAFIHMSRVWAGWSSNSQGDVVEANRLALRAVRQDDTDSFAHFTLGTALSCTGHMQQAIAELEYALALYPQFAAAAGELGRLLAFSGRTAEATEYVLQAIDASPHDPHLSLWVRSRAIACFVEQDYASAVVYAQQAAAKRSNWFFNYYLLAASQVATGDLAAAQKSFATGQTFGPYSMQALRVGHPFVDPVVLDRFVGLLRQAGWSG